MDDKNPIQELQARELECVSGGDGVLSWITGILTPAPDNGGAVPAKNANTGVRG